MSKHGDENSFEPSQVPAGHNVDGQIMENQKRRITRSSKAFENTVNDKLETAICKRSKLTALLNKFEKSEDYINKKHVDELTKLTDEYGVIASELNCLFEQDKYRVFKEEADWFKQEQTASEAYKMIKELKISQSDRRSEAPSWRSKSSSHRSRRSSSSTSSYTRLNALAEAAAAQENAKYERVMAAKEHDCRQRELEHAKEMAILIADKKAAIANAKLKAIEEALQEEESAERVNLPETPDMRVEERTSDWVNSVLSHENTLPGTNIVDNYPPRDLGGGPQFSHQPTTTLGGGPQFSNQPTTTPGGGPQFSREPTTNLGGMVPAMSIGNSPQQTPSQPSVSQLNQIGDATGSQLIESLTSANRQVVAGLARQNLPKCHPDLFTGDATLFHPWKRAFKAMIKDTSVTAEQEINYLRSFTRGEVQRVVDNFRKRHQNDPTTLLQNLWKELETRFGSAAVITNALLERLHNSSNFHENDHAKLQEFSDLCADVNSQIEHLPGLACLHYPGAIRPIVEKLPASLRSKWEKEVVKHAESHHDAYPGFSIFTRVVKAQATIKNHPNILAGSPQKPVFERRRGNPRDQRALRTNLDSDEDTPQNRPPNAKKWCPYHECDRHGLTECKAFAAKSLNEKTDWIQKARLCFRCLKEGHQAKKCEAKISCTICGNDRHLALLHKGKVDRDSEDGKNTQIDGEEDTTDQVNNTCTAVCRDNDGGVSCSKILLVDIVSPDEPSVSCRAYAIIDDQSNSSLISSELADKLGANGPKEKYYLSTCSGNRETKFGRRVSGLVIRSASNGREAQLPTLVECENFPDDKKEIPTPEVARKFPHLQDIAREIPPIDESAGLHILLGRDASELLKVRAFKNGPKGAPWAQKLLLGWTITGQMCLNYLNGPVHIEARRTSTTSSSSNEAHVAAAPTSTKVDGVEYYVVPCPNQMKITDSVTGSNVFCSTPLDNEVSLSIEDRKFIEMMEKQIRKNSTGHWEMPLPFRQTDTALPNNRVQAVHRLNGLLKTLKRKPQMEKDYLEFMETMISKGHATPVPREEIKGQHGRVWYLPHFGVYHPKKPTKVRVVFDASAEFDGVSLNKVLLPGPDLMNSLLGVLIRFRRERVGVMCDIEQMFYSFYVDPEHRDYLRFLWYRDNDPQKQVIEYRMNVHLFGNGPSPAVATFGLRKTALEGEEKHGEEVKDFVYRNFYVDDGLASLPTDEEAINLIISAQNVLATSNLRLHKVVSNSVRVMEAFSTEDRAKALRDLDLRRDILPAQRSLGVYWNLENDVLTFHISLPDKPFTRRGVLSVINSVYDPLGMAAPAVLEGRKLLQHLVATSKGTAEETPLAWDDPLPEKIMSRWQCWKDSLEDLQHVSVPRCYRPNSFGTTARAELHGFSDASKDAIGAAVYLKLWNKKNEVSVSFVYGQARLAPIHPVSIPRLELCGAVLVVEAVQKVLKEIDLKIAEVTYYTDSKVVLGYIANEGKRFYVYVANRVQLIRSLSSPDQWRYVQSERNPADLATRGVRPSKLMESGWLSGPEFLKNTDNIPPPSEITTPSESDPEVRCEVINSATKIDENNNTMGLGAKRFERFSSLSSLQRAIALLIVKVRKFNCRRRQQLTGIETEKNEQIHSTTEALTQAMTVIVRATQKEEFKSELKQSRKATTNEDARQRGEVITDKKLQRNTRLYRLDPFVDIDGVLRVGGRLRRAEFELGEKHPIILPRNDHVSRLVVRHYHQRVHHQGRCITRGAVRQAGYWIIGGHNVTSKEIHSCVTCKRLRGRPLEQQMADLPADRLEVGAPFTNVGFDVFGPWEVHTRKTRGGAANSKRWGLVFTCLTSRAIHIELLESMDASAFICALRRFFALRGQATILRCDQGTNFVGGKSELDFGKIQQFVTEQECQWRMNPPHASHFGGVWERQIGTIRRVLDGMFLELGKAQLTHELLATLMAEVTGIVNARPLTAVPTEVDDPQPLSPAMLLTMKTRPLGPPPGNFLPTDLYVRRRWKRVQYLADQFWLRWRREYLQSLQSRKKWNLPQRDLVEGDVVLMKEQGVYRNHWPLGRVANAMKSEDGKVRKVSISIIRDGKKKTMFRPIKELILLVPGDKTTNDDGEKE